MARYIVAEFEPRLLDAKTWAVTDFAKRPLPTPRPRSLAHVMHLRLKGVSGGDVREAS